MYCIAYRHKPNCAFRLQFAVWTLPFDASLGAVVVRLAREQKPAASPIEPVDDQSGKETAITNMAARCHAGVYACVCVIQDRVMHVSMGHSNRRGGGRERTPAS